MTKYLKILDLYDKINGEVTMGFVSYSSETIISNQTAVDNIFINEYLPKAPESCVKVYLYGLYKCSNPNAYDNTIESFAQQLNLSVEDVKSAFLYWQEQGLVQILSTFPIEVKYIPAINALNGTKRFSKTKYENFNKQAEMIINSRIITPSEYNEYYTTIESLQIEPEAFLMIMNYCTKLKGKDVGYKYILTVAKNWAYSNIKTSQLVEEKIIELEEQNSEISDLFKTLQIKRTTTVEDKELFSKWTKDMEFDKDVISYVAKLCKKQFKSSSFEKLDSKLLSYYENKLTSIKEIDEYEQNKFSLFDTAKNVCKSIGVYYENLDAVVENYIIKWNSMGYDKTTLEKIANYCFKSSIRTLDGVDIILNKLYKLGIVSELAMNKYLNEILSTDESIKQLLYKMNLKRQVNSWDRQYYSTWKEKWNLTDTLIDFATSFASDKSSPMQYLNKLLSVWFEKNVTTIEQAKKYIPDNKEKTKQNFNQREYKKEELNALFSSLDEVELE